MEIEEALYSRLSTDAPLIAEVADRIYPVEAKQGTTNPFLVFTRLYTQGNATMNLASGLYASRFTFEAWAKDATKARDVATKIRSCLDGFSGTIMTVRIWGIIFVDRYQTYEADSRLFSDVIDLRIFHN